MVAMPLELVLALVMILALVLVTLLAPLLGLQQVEAALETFPALDATIYSQPRCGQALAVLWGAHPMGKVWLDWAKLAASVPLLLLVQDCDA